jgi:opacity protein-like surface antigen
MVPFTLRSYCRWIVATASVIALERSSFAQVPAPSTAAPRFPAAIAAPPAPDASTIRQAPSSPAAPTPPDPPGEPHEKAAEPFAFGDFTWLNGSNRQHKALLDTPIFTGSFLLDVNYTASAHNPIDNTVTGSTALSRNNEMTLAFVGIGGDLHYEHARGRLMLQYGTRSTLVPRNDFSSFHGQLDLQTALRYISEAYGGYHWDVLNGINLDMGIFMSYVGLFSYDNFENWMYMPSYTSDNTPWFFNGVRLQIYTSDKLKIEPWLINGWQTYGRFNEMPGLGFQILWRPVEYFSVLANGYGGWDTQDNPGRFRFHSDNSVELKYFDQPRSSFIDKAAFSVTFDLGGEQGDGVTPFGGSGTEKLNAQGVNVGCSTAVPCTQQFLSAMAYNRLWFLHDIAAFTVGGGFMHNPGRYLALLPTGVASPIPQPLSIQGIQYTAVSQTAFDTNSGTQLDAWDVSGGFQYMPAEQVTYGLEFNHRQASVPYFAGHGGVTSPDGYITTAVPPGWRPDLSKNDDRVIFSALIRF